MNRAMYTLSIVAAIFLPLGLLTGLLGINVGGMPGTENPWAFVIVTVLLIALAILLVAWFKKIKWL
jgi:zinc transporter